MRYVIAVMAIIIGISADCASKTIEQLTKEVSTLKAKKANIDKQLAVKRKELISIKAQLAVLYKKSCIKKKYWYEVKGGIRKDKPVLHDEKPPKNVRGKIKWVFKYPYKPDYLKYKKDVYDKKIAEINSLLSQRKKISDEIVHIYGVIRYKKQHR